MKPAPFEYRVAESVDHALALLAEHGDDAKVLAGGQSLVPLLNFRLAQPTMLIDVNSLSTLGTISVDADSTTLGALVRQRQAETAPEVHVALPMLVRALEHVGHLAIRTRGTIGGSIAHSDPAAELPAVLTALGAHIVANRSGGAREVPVEEFFVGPMTTCLESDELITHIRISNPSQRSGWAFEEFSRRHGDFAIVGVAAMMTCDDEGRATAARLVWSGVGPTPIRSAAAEAALIGERVDSDAIRHAAEVGARSLDPPADLHGTSEYRRHLARVLADRALTVAHERTGVNR